VEPERTCIGCRNRDLQSRMIRLVRIGDEIVDATRPRLPGRGAYLHAGCLRVAEKRQALRRAFGPGALLTGSLRTRLSQNLPVGI
jgi:Predicted nucleic-acid-binding protein implicated in transcription termination